MFLFIFTYYLFESSGQTFIESLFQGNNIQDVIESINDWVNSNRGYKLTTITNFDTTAGWYIIATWESNNTYRKSNKS